MLMGLVPWHHCALQKSGSFGSLSVIFRFWRQSSGLGAILLKMLFSDLHQRHLGFCKSKSNFSPTSHQIRCTKAGLSDPCFNSLFRNLSYSALGAIECSALARHHSHTESIELGSSHIFLWSVMKWASKGGNESALWHPSLCELKLRNSRGRSRLRRAFQTCLTPLCCHYFSIFKFLNFHLGISPVLDSNYLFKGSQIILLIVSKNDGVFKNLLKKQAGIKEFNKNSGWLHSQDEQMLYDSSYNYIKIKL